MRDTKSRIDTTGGFIDKTGLVNDGFGGGQRQATGDIITGMGDG